MPDAPKFIAIDFFCGAGGTTRGLIDAGGLVIAGIDKDPRCQLTFESNNVHSNFGGVEAEFICADIFPEEPDYPEGEQALLFSIIEDRVNFAKEMHPSLPLIFAICAPCQPFTKISKKKLTQERSEGRKKDRNLLSEAMKFVERFEPDFVLSENVSGIRSKRYGTVWTDFIEQLEKAEYLTGSQLVCCSKFGIPQFRQRSILLAAKRGVVHPDYIADLHQTSILVPDSDPDANMVSVREAIGHIPAIAAGEAHDEIPNHRARTLSELNLKRISVAQPGQSNAYMKNTKFGDLSLDCHNKVNERMGQRCFGDVYTRMHPDRPSPTITTKCHSISNGRFGHYDTSQDRGISLREAAILQSFPDDYVFYPENQVEPVARMIGNAVPPKLAEFFAGYMIEISGHLHDNN